MKKRWRHSYSQLDTWVGCKRKWGLRLIDKDRRQNRFAVRGSNIHVYTEDWLLEAKPPPVSSPDEVVRRQANMALALFRQLPKPKTPNIYIEHPFEFESEGGFIFIGKLDLLELKLPRPEIIDSKTTTDFKWIKAKANLDNIQTLMYSQYAFTLDEDIEEVLFRWAAVVDRKKGPTARSFPKEGPLVISRADVAARFPTMIEKVAYEIETEGLCVKTGMDLPPNPLYCDAFGGCQYRDRCNITSKEYFRARMTQHTLREKIMSNTNGMSRLEQMKAKAGAQAQQQKPAQTQTQAAPAAVTTQAAPAAGLSRLEQLKLKAQSAAEAPAQHAQSVNPPEQPANPQIDAPEEQESGKSSKPRASKSPDHSAEASIYAKVFSTALQAGHDHDVSSTMARFAVADFREHAFAGFTKPE